MLKISHADCFGLSPATSSQFTVEMCDAAKNCKTNHQNPSFEGSRSFKVIDVNKSEKSTSPVLVMICSKSVPICNHFHTVRANNGKITSF